MTKIYLRKTVSIAAALGFLTVPALAEDVQLSGAASPSAGPLAVKARAGRFDQVMATKVQIPLKLKASLVNAGHSWKIVGSSLFLKQGGTGSGAPATDAMANAAPAPALTADSKFDFDIDPQGPVAQNAIALCNATPGAREVSMSSPIIWRVTTGRFNFKWVNYDAVAPTPEIVANPEFYADRETHDVEIAASILVSCEKEGTKAAVTAPKATPAKKPAPAKDEAKRVIEPAKLAADEPEAAPEDMKVEPKVETANDKSDAKPDAEPVKTVSLEPAEAPICSGGMVRKTGSGSASYACLCPGNTERIETGTNSFACEKRTGRRS